MSETNETPSQAASGWYKHEETGAVVELVNEPEFGTPLTNAFIKAGYSYVGETDPRKKTKSNPEKEGK